MDKRNEKSPEMLGDVSTNLETDALLKLLLDEDRLAILGLLALRPHTIAELTALLPGKRTPPAKHVAQLTAAGLLSQVNDPVNDPVNNEVNGDRYTLMCASFKPGSAASLRVLPNPPRQHQMSRSWRLLFVMARWCSTLPNRVNEWWCCAG